MGQFDVFADMLSDGLRTSSKPSIGLYDWMCSNRRMLAPDRPFDIESHKYMRGIYECDAQHIVLYKSAQLGISEYLISAGLWGCEVLNATVMYVFSTDSALSSFSAGRLGPAIDASQHLASLVTPGSNRGADRVKLKRVGNRFMHFCGSAVTKDGKAPQLKSTPVDMLIIDEVDECDPRAIPLAKKRLGHSRLKYERHGSTPSYNGVGIHAMWGETDKRLWMIPCLSCGHRQNVTIENIVHESDSLERPTAWHGQDDDTAYPVCAKCKRRLDLSVHGEWVATHPSIEDAGFHVTKFAAPWADFYGIVKDLQDIDETKRRETYNQDLGIPYKASGISVTHDLVMGLRRDYAYGPSLDKPCYMGVDVGAVLHVVIREAEHPETGERRQLFAGTVEDFEDIDDLIGLYKPLRVVCDALPETRSARKMQRRHEKGLVWLAYYDNLKDGTKRPDPLNWKRKDRTVMCDRTRTMDGTVARFADGINTVSQRIKSIEHYIEQVCCPVRVRETRRDGSIVVKYINSTADHYFHAENYCAIASDGKPLSRMA